MPKVLIVDDDSGIRETMKDILLLEGFDVETADSGEQALTACGRTGFDFVLLDICLPGMNGVQALQAIKRLAPSVRTIMITGHDVGDLAEQAMQAGAEAVFRKPLNMASFLSLLLLTSQTGG